MTEYSAFPAEQPVDVTASYTVLYVTGVGHSGSTLLNLLLNAHSGVVGLCELHFIRRYLQLSENDELYPLRFHLWQDVARCWEGKVGVPFEDIKIDTPSRAEKKNWTDQEFETYRIHNRVMFKCVSDISGARILVDTSKSVNRLKMLAQCGIPLRVVHLVRDGRGVVNSYRRKYGGFRVGFRRWFLRTLSGPWTRRRLHNIEWVVIRYEDLAGSPEKTLRRICEFAGLRYEPAMLQYWETEDVSIGGNRMRGMKRPVRLDEKWLQELPGIDRVAFTLAGSWLNRLYGYPVLGMYQPREDQVREIP